MFCISWFIILILLLALIGLNSLCNDRVIITNYHDYYSTMMSFDHIRKRKRVKYESAFWFDRFIMEHQCLVSCPMSETKKND